MDTKPKEPELSLTDWCRLRGCSYDSAAAAAERERREHRDALLARVEAARRDTSSTTTTAQPMSYYRQRLAGARRWGSGTPAASSGSTSSITPAPAGRTARRVISTKRVRYGGNDVQETVLDVGGLLFKVQECSAWQRPHVERLEDGGASRSAGGYTRRDHTSLASYQEVRRWQG